MSHISFSFPLVYIHCAVVRAEIIVKKSFKKGGAEVKLSSSLLSQISLKKSFQ